MQLFSRNKKKKEEAQTDTKQTQPEQKAGQHSVAARDVTRVLERPHITEKAAILADSNTYVFRVRPRASKTQIKRAIKAVYKKTPIKVNIAKKPDTSVLRRKGRGVRRGYTKAYVFLKKGESIDIV